MPAKSSKMRLKKRTLGKRGPSVAGHRAAKAAALPDSQNALGSGMDSAIGTVPCWDAKEPDIDCLFK